MFGKTLEIDQLEREIQRLKDRADVLDAELRRQQRTHRRLLDYLGLREVEQERVRLEPIGDGV